MEVHPRVTRRAVAVARTAATTGGGTNWLGLATRTEPPSCGWQTAAHKGRLT